MQMIEAGSVKYLTFSHFDAAQAVKHCFSTRIGGVSSGPFQAMNLGLTRGDSRDLVMENYRILCEAVGFDMHKTVMSKRQVHGSKIHCVTEADSGKGLYAENDLDGFDGLVTNMPGIVLITFHADCTPLYFFDPVKKVIGLAHAGWRGTVDGIAYEALKVMVEQYGCKAETILAGIGPAISTCCFEVDEPVVMEFERRLPFSVDYIFADRQKRGKYKIDLKGINAKIMELSGILKQNIEIAEECTKCNSQYFYSHRGMGESRGSMAAFLSLV